MDLNDARFKLIRNCPIPLYYQLKRIVLNELANGSLKMGDKLPAEVEFCECLQLSRPTVRLALNELVSEGVLVRKKNSGSYVAEPKIELTPAIGIENFSKYMLSMSRNCTIERLDFCELDGIEEINNRLGIDKNERLIYLKRLWRGDETPIVYNATYLPGSSVIDFDEWDYTTQSLHDFLSSSRKIYVKNIIIRIESVLASKNDIELLRINRTRASLMYVAELSFDKNDKPICWSISRYRGDKVIVSLQHHSN